MYYCPEHPIQHKRESNGEENVEAEIIGNYVVK